MNKSQESKYGNKIKRIDGSKITFKKQQVEEFKTPALITDQQNSELFLGKLSKKVRKIDKPYF